jgi:hypothetical protein
MEGKGNQQNQIHIVESSSSMTNGVLPKRQRIRLDSNSNTKNNNTRTMEEPSSVSAYLILYIYRRIIRLINQERSNNEKPLINNQNKEYTVEVKNQKFYQMFNLGISW